jgi:hypothetical protein
MMNQVIKISEELALEAKRYGEAFHRSPPKQIEYWSRIGKMAEENPDLPFSLLKDIMLAQKEMADGVVEPYVMG